MKLNPDYDYNDKDTMAEVQKIKEKDPETGKDIEKTDFRLT